MSKIIEPLSVDEIIKPPSIDEIKTYFGITLDKARLTHMLMNCGEDYTFIMKVCNTVLGLDGVEKAQARKKWKVARIIVYLGTGDTYARTLSYVPTYGYYLATFEDIVEHFENKEGWEFD